MELPKLPLWYGIPGIEFIWHGNYSDPELRYKHRTFNEFSVEQGCLYTWEEERSNLSFDTWMPLHPEVAYGFLDELVEEDDMTIDDWRFDPNQEPRCAYDYLAHKILESGYEIKTGLSNLMVMMILHFDTHQEEVDFMEAHIDSPEEWAQAVIDEAELSGGFREFDYWC